MEEILPGIRSWSIVTHFGWQTVKACGSSGHRALRQLAEHAEIYEKSIDNIITQVNAEHSAGYQQEDFGETHENW